MNTTIQSMNWLAGLSEDNQYCLECGAGQGEVAQYMTNHFGHAFAIDKDTRYLNAGVNGVTVVCGKAEDLPFSDDMFDLVLAVQSLQYFNHDSFVDEVRRVLKSGGIFAALGWGKMELPDNIVPRYQATFDALDPYWESGREWVVSGYMGLEFDGKEVLWPSTSRTQHLTANQIDLTIAGWTAMRRAIEADADIPDPDTDCRFICSNKRYSVNWPLLGKVFRL